VGTIHEDDNDNETITFTSCSSCTHNRNRNTNRNTHYIIIGHKIVNKRRRGRRRKEEKFLDSRFYGEGEEVWKCRKEKG